MTMLAEPGSRRAASSFWRVRVAAVTAAAAAALVAWVVIEPIFGVELRAPAFGEATETSDVGAVQVLLASLGGSLAGWAFLSLLERLTASAAKIWIVAATAALLLSLGGPLSGSDVGTGNRIALIALHLVVGAVLIPTLYRSARQPTET